MVTTEIKRGRAIADNVLGYGVPSSIAKRGEKRKNRASGVLRHLQRTSGQNKKTPHSRSATDKNLLHIRNWTMFDACQPNQGLSDKT